ncbi:MAG: hypothetical protein ACJ07L_15215 [Opitutales bacterium]
MNLRLALIVLVSIGMLGLSANAQTEIGPYASEVELGALIGENAKVVGVFHKDAFGAPAIAISGRVFFLLETPPSKQSFDFPKNSRGASVEGILYLYDGRLQFSEQYQVFGDRYYFFNIDAAKIEFGEPLKASGEAANDPFEPILGNWRFDLESTEAEVYKFDNEEFRKFLAPMIEVFRDSEVVIRRDRIRMYMPSRDVRSDEQYEVVEQSDKGFVLRLTEPSLKTTRDWNVKVDVEGRLQVGTENPQLKDFTFFYNRW